MMRRRFGGPYAGAIRIGMALLTGLVLLMVLRVLAEIGLAIISLSNRMGTADSK